jgi:hypothetical protein
MKNSPFILPPLSFILRFTAPPRFERGSSGPEPEVLPVTPQGITQSCAMQESNLRGDVGMVA